MSGVAITRTGTPAVRLNALDRLIGVVSPQMAVDRFRARASLAVAGGYLGARHDRRALKQWSPSQRSANDDTIGDLPDLRARSRDLIRNTPIATGAVTTQATAVVGSGLEPHPRIDHELLGITEDEADAWERRASRVWDLHAMSSAIDATGVATFAELSELVLRGELGSGDILAVRRFRPGPGRILGTQVQLIEADRIRSPQELEREGRVVAGVELDAGAPMAYHVATTHPVRGWFSGLFGSTATQWHRIPRYDADGRPQALLIYHQERPDQVRGVPYLAPVIETLKQLDRFTEAELAAAVISACFTVFVKTKLPELDGDEVAPTWNPGVTQAAGEARPPRSAEDLQLGSGAFIELSEGEDVSFASPTRPNDQFDPYFLAMVRQIGIALEIPYEVLIRHFSSSYSASRAAMIEAWRGFMKRRARLIRQWCNPVREWVITEAVARGYLDAPGFFDDPLIRAAWLDCEWAGPAMPQLDPLKEITAARDRVALTVTTLEEETAGMTGGSWERKFRQTKKERRMLAAAGLSIPDAAPVLVTSNQEAA